MSKANITGMNPRDFSVTFQCRSGEVRTYWYEKSDFFEILAGADPAGFSGSQTPTTSGSGSQFADVADAVIDIAEIL